MLPGVVHNLVIPGRFLHLVHSEDDLDAYIDQTGLKGLRSNLRQLLGYQDVGKERRYRRKRQMRGARALGTHRLAGAEARLG